jgi:uncharacterized SAM-binding protein YcdF (DUF218 family)
LNELFSLLGIEAWKPALTALVLPPVPLLLLILVGARLILPRRGLGWLLVLIGTLGIWLSACNGAGALLTQFMLRPPPALSADAIARLKSDVKARQPLTIVVLGGGRDMFAPEYGRSTLRPRSLERLHYGVWLARETGATLGFSGGVGWGDKSGPSEAEVAAYVAVKDFGLALKWTEGDSRDTRENAIRTVALLKQAGVTRAVLVTHAWHMPRALRLFEAAAGGAIEFIAAPIALAPLSRGGAVDWIPSAEGFERVRLVLREGLARLAGD